MIKMECVVLKIAVRKFAVMLTVEWLISSYFMKRIYQGIDIARRTVAKYREQMGILSSSKRKKVF